MKTIPVSLFSTALFLALGPVGLGQNGGSSSAPSNTSWVCGCNAHPGQAHPHSFSISDCRFTTNETTAEYDPGVLYEIPVVFHIISDTTGAGAIPDQDVIDQMARLNDDMSGRTLGLGNDTGIRFRLATVDPNGAATTGIQRATNDLWFRDAGAYYSTLGWDTRRYLNVYTLDVQGGITGYVPDVPQGPFFNFNRDRIVMKYTTINSGLFGHILAHEVGHYLGLFHTWGSGNTCENQICNSQGDLICDTNPHRDPTQICASNSFGCTAIEPSHNYMNYLAISCAYEFTPIQIQRMRCTLENYRSDLGQTSNYGTPYCTGAINSTGAVGTVAATGSPVASANTLRLTASHLPPSQFGIFVTSRLQNFIPGAGGTSNGNICLGGLIGRLNRAGEILSTGGTGEFTLQVDLTNLPQGNGIASVTAGETWNFQAWHRDGVGLGSNFTEAIELLFE